MSDECENSPLQPKRNSTAGRSPLAMFSSPMRHTPGQRVHTVEGPGRQSSMLVRHTSVERMVNNASSDGTGFRRSGASLTELNLPSAARNAPSKPTTAKGDAETIAEEEVSSSNWGVARSKFSDPPLCERRQTFSAVVGAAIEARKQSWREDRQMSQFFDAAVVNQVMRQRRIHKSRRTRVLLLLDEPRSSHLAFVIFSTMLVLIFVSVLLVIIESIPPPESAQPVLWYVELACSIAFSIELLVRFAAADPLCATLADVYMWIDFLSIVPFLVDLVYIAIAADDDGGSFLDALRLARLLRLLKLARHYEGTRVLIDALRDSVSALMAPLFFLFVSVILFAGALYHAERGGPAHDDFDNILKCAWFMLVTFSTVGYGDRTPGTPFGKSLTCVAIVGGVLFMAMPITIVGSSFANVWENKETKDVVRKMQELLLERGLRATDVLTVFHEFDRTNDGEIDLQEFKGALEVLGLKLRPHQVRKLFDAFDKDRNNTVDFVEFCHVIFPDLDEEKLLEEYSLRARDTPRTRARSVFVMQQLRAANADAAAAAAAEADAAEEGLVEASLSKIFGRRSGGGARPDREREGELAEGSDGGGARPEASGMAASFKKRCWSPWTPGQSRGRDAAARVPTSAMDASARLGRNDGRAGAAQTSALEGAPAAASATAAAGGAAEGLPGRLGRAGSSNKLAAGPLSLRPAGRQKIYQKKKRRSASQLDTPGESLTPTLAPADLEPLDLATTARAYAAALTSRRAGAGAGAGAGVGAEGAPDGGAVGRGMAVAAGAGLEPLAPAPPPADAAALGEVLRLLRRALERIDELDDSLQQQAARQQRERRAALDVQGGAINAVASRLGATTSQAVVRAFKSAENVQRAVETSSSSSSAAAAASAAPGEARAQAQARKNSRVNGRDSSLFEA